MILQLTKEEISRLQPLAKNARTVEALKKLFLNSFLKPEKSDVQTLAASRIALDLLDRAFKELEYYQNVEPTKQDIINPAL